MVIDTSALVAMLTDEPDAPGLEAAVEADPVRLMSTASFVEAAIVIETRFGEPGGRELDLWMHRAGVNLVAVDADQADTADDELLQHQGCSAFSRASRNMPFSAGKPMVTRK